MKLYDIQVNHLEDPIGFRMERVCFSWKVKDAKGKKQKSARAVVAYDAAMTDLVLDTGFDERADSLCFAVPLQLRPRTRYYYQIHARSDAGEEASSDVHFFETALRGEPWQAKWISCDNSVKRHPVFEKEIVPKMEVASARLYICGLGLYEASFGGKKIGNEFLTPYSNDYDRWVQYQTYDVTELLQKCGILSVALGNGWYKGRFGFSAFEEKGFYGDAWKLIAQLHLRYTDGTEEIIGTDESWTVRRSNITFSNLYDGEHRDDTLEALPTEQAVFCDAPKGTLTERMSTPVTVHETLKPVELIRTPKNELVLDIGQVITGSFILHVDVPKGQKVHIQTGEVMQQGCFYNENLRSAKSEYIYISDGEPIDLQPQFTFYGYRYVKIEGIEDLKTEDFTALALYSHIPQRGTMTTGHELLNQFLSNVRWGMKDNFLDVPTDCPQRDERMGWTGDTQVFSPTAMYLHDTYSFYAKYLYDVYQEQLDLDGKVPAVVPSAGVTNCSCVWGDAACIIPWNMYQFYGDKQILADQFESMKAWVDYLTRLDGDNHAWRDHTHYGDWLALDNMNGNEEAVKGATDDGFLANLYYALSAQLVAKAARVLGDTEAEEKYEALFRREKETVKQEYYSPTGRPCINTQTGLLLTLKHDLSSDPERVKQMLRQLFDKTGNTLQTGFTGTPLLCNVLSDHGMEDLAWELLLNEGYPGWLREVKLGATTVWERWNSLLDDGTISGVSMNSMNHYAYGSVVEWMFRRIAGLSVSEDHPGCRHMDLRPLVNWKIRHQQTVYDSPAGEYRSAWKIVDPKHIQLQVTVPFGCTATLVLPEGDGAVISLEPGSYTYTYETGRDLRPGYDRDTPLYQIRKDQQVWDALGAVIALHNVPKRKRDCSINGLLGRYLFLSPETLQQVDALFQQLREALD